MRGHTGQSRFPYDDDDDDHYAGAQAGLTSLRAQLSRVADTWEAQKNRERAADARRINSLTAELRQSQTEVAEVQGARAAAEKERDDAREALRASQAEAAEAQRALTAKTMHFMGACFLVAELREALGPLLAESVVEVEVPRPAALAAGAAADAGEGDTGGAAAAAAASRSRSRSASSAWKKNRSHSARWIFFDSSLSMAWNMISKRSFVPSSCRIRSGRLSISRRSSLSGSLSALIRSIREMSPSPLRSMRLKASRTRPRNASSETDSPRRRDAARKR